MPVTLLRPKPTRRFPLKKWPLNALSATASSTYNASFPAAKAIDGNMFLDSAGSGWVSNGAFVGAWLQVDYARNYAKKIVCIGDSITEGHPNHDNDPSVYLDGDNPLSQYESHLARMLPDWTITNKGVGSDTTSGMVARFAADVVAENPAYVIILGGVNDISGAAALATIEGNLQNMYETALQNGIMPVACTLLPWNNGTVAQKDTLDQLNAWIRAYARDNQIPLIEFFKGMEDPANPRNMPAALVADGVHPTVAGYRQMGEIIDPTIFERHRYLRSLLISTRVATMLGGIMMPTKVRLEVGNLTQEVALNALLTNNYEGLFVIDLADEYVATNSVKITILEAVRNPLATYDGYTGLGEVELYF